jgi:hypothetical protein
MYCTMKGHDHESLPPLDVPVLAFYPMGAHGHGHGHGRALSKSAWPLTAVLRSTGCTKAGAGISISHA